MRSLDEYARAHGGQVETSKQVRLLSLYLIRTPPHKLVCDVHEYADGTVLLGRIPTKRESREGKTVWHETHVDRVVVRDPESIPSQHPGGALGEVSDSPGPTWAPYSEPPVTKQVARPGQRLKRTAVPQGQAKLNFAK